MLSEKSISELKEGLNTLNIEVNEKQIRMLNQFWDLYSTWNQKINLSSITQENDFLKKHVLDSAVGLKFISLDENIADLGTGGGFPGIILKILKPEIKISLIENTLKKVKYLEEVIEKIDLDIKVYNPTTEKIPNNFDLVVTRAFGNISQIIRIGKNYTKKKIIAYKGKYEKIVQEINESNLKNIKISIERVDVPFTDFERHIVIIESK